MGLRQPSQIRPCPDAWSNGQPSLAALVWSAFGLPARFSFVVRVPLSESAPLMFQPVCASDPGWGRGLNEAKTMKAGAAQLDIPLPSGLELAGFAKRSQPSTGVLDPMFVRALYLEDGAERPQEKLAAAL